MSKPVAPDGYVVGPVSGGGGGGAGGRVVVVVGESRPPTLLTAFVSDCRAVLFGIVAGGRAGSVGGSFGRAGSFGVVVGGTVSGGTVIGGTVRPGSDGSGGTGGGGCTLGLGNVISTNPGACRRAPLGGTPPSIAFSRSRSSSASEQPSVSTRYVPTIVPNATLKSCPVTRSCRGAQTGADVEAGGATGESTAFGAARLGA